MARRSDETTEKVYLAMLKLQEELPPRGPALQDIADEAGLAHKATVSNHIRHLVKDGLVEDMGGGRGRYRAISLSEIAERRLEKQ